MTQPAKAGYLTAHLYGHSRPVASTLNFTAGQTIASLAMVQTGAYGVFTAYNGSPGPVQLVADQYGFFIAPWKG